MHLANINNNAQKNIYFMLYQSLVQHTFQFQLLKVFLVMDKVLLDLRKTVKYFNKTKPQKGDKAKYCIWNKNDYSA